MKKVIHGRELFALEVLGVAVQGTCHQPDEQSPGAKAKLHKHNGTGVWFLSGLLAPRAGVGDSLVYWADSLARGYRIP